MIALYLLAAHLVGDFVLATRSQSTGKFGWTAAAMRFRTTHVTGYCLPFVPVAAAHGWTRAVAFLASLWLLHWLTDAQRFHSTLGDVVVWRAVRAATRRLRSSGSTAEVRARAEELAARTPPWPPPNPWPPLPVLIDQTLHVCQLALLGGLLLT